jgi:hypothetical protein
MSAMAAHHLANSCQYTNIFVELGRICLKNLQEHVQLKVSSACTFSARGGLVNWTSEEDLLVKLASGTLCAVRGRQCALEVRCDHKDDIYCMNLSNSLTESIEDAPVCIEPSVVIS